MTWPTSTSPGLKGTKASCSSARRTRKPVSSAPRSADGLTGQAIPGSSGRRPGQSLLRLHPRPRLRSAVPQGLLVLSLCNEAASLEYDQKSRTHVSLGTDAPVSRAVATASDGAIVAISQLGGRHHRYERRAA